MIVSNIKAPTQVIGDPASLSVEWTVSNIGTGTGLNTTWTDTVIYSTDDIIGNSDDIVLGKVVHDGALEKTIATPRLFSIDLVLILLDMVTFLFKQIA